MLAHFWLYMLQISPTLWKAISLYDGLHLIIIGFLNSHLISYFLWFVLL